jgi:hypothetical protein
MSDDPKPQREHESKVGSFMAPDGLFSVPLRNLSDEIPEGDPKPRPAKRPTWLARAITRLGHVGH